MSKFFREIHAKLPPDMFEFVSKARTDSKLKWDEFPVVAAILLRSADPKTIEEAKRKMNNGEWSK